MCQWGQHIVFKALRKAEYSDFHIFAKFGTHFFLYSVYSVLCQNRILQNTKHMTKLTKQTKLTKLNFFRPKMRPRAQKQGLGVQERTFWAQNPVFCIYGINCFIIEFIFSQKKLLPTQILIENLIMITDLRALIVLINNVFLILWTNCHYCYFEIAVKLTYKMWVTPSSRFGYYFQTAYRNALINCVIL